MKIIVVFGLLLFLGLAHSQTNCASKNPNVLAPKKWVPSAGCPRGSYYEDGANRCHCWSFCGYICEPNIFATSPPPPTTPTKPTTPTEGTTTPTTTKAPTPATCSGGKVMFIPNQATATTVCICITPPNGYACSPVS